MTRSGRPEYVILLAVVGVLIAVGVPSLQRGETVTGWACIGVATVVLASAGIGAWRRGRE